MVCLIVSIIPPLQDVSYLPVRFPIIYEAFGGQLLPGEIEGRTLQTQDLHYGPVGIKTPPLPVPYHHQKEIQDHGFMA
jgi:hypothetical protein